MSMIQRFVHIYSLALGLFLGLLWETISLTSHDSGLLNISDAAYVLSLVFVFTAVFIWLMPYSQVKVRKGLSVVSIMFISAGIFFPNMMLFVSPAGAFILFDFIDKVRKSRDTARFWTGFFMGIVLSLGILYTGILTGVNIMMTATLVSAGLLILWIWKSPAESGLMSKALPYSSRQGPLLSYDWVMSTLAVLIMTQWVFWHLFLSHLLTEKNVAYQLVTTMLFSVAGWRYYTSGDRKWHSPGGKFMAAMLVTIALGWVYTSYIYWMFAFLFVPGITLLFRPSQDFPFSQWSRMHISITLILISILWMISGFYASNHLDFVLDLQMTNDLALQSFLQAWTKELTSVAAVVMVISGVRFLKPQWFARFDTGTILSAPEE